MRQSRRALPCPGRASVLSLAHTRALRAHGASNLWGLYCTPKALWKLNWFLRDFGYDTELLGRDEVDEKALLGLRGVVRVSRRSVLGDDAEQNLLTLCANCHERIHLKATKTTRAGLAS